MTTNSPQVTLRSSEKILKESKQALELQQDLWARINRITIPLKRRGEQNHFSEGIRKMFNEPSQ